MQRILFKQPVLFCVACGVLGVIIAAALFLGLLGDSAVSLASGGKQGAQLTGTSGEKGGGKEAEKGEPGKGGFAFPGDASGKQLAQSLPPTGNGKLPTVPANKPQPRIVPPAIKEPNPRTSVPPVHVPRLTVTGVPGAQTPGGVAEEMPLVTDLDRLPLPESGVLPVAPAVSAPSPDLNTPPILVGVTQPAPAGLQLSQPSQSASREAALAALSAARQEAAPFVRFFLPDPYANRKVSELYETPPEDATPVTGTPIVPGP